MGLILSVIMIFGMISVLYVAISPALFALRAREIIRSWKLTPAQQHTLDRSLTGALWVLAPTTLWLFGCLNRDIALMLGSRGFPPVPTVPTVATTTPHGPLTIGQIAANMSHTMHTLSAVWTIFPSLGGPLAVPMITAPLVLLSAGLLVCAVRFKSVLKECIAHDAHAPHNIQGI